MTTRVTDTWSLLSSGAMPPLSSPPIPNPIPHAPRPKPLGRERGQGLGQWWWRLRLHESKHSFQESHLYGGIDHRTRRDGAPYLAFPLGHGAVSFMSAMEPRTRDSRWWEPRQQKDGARVSLASMELLITAF